MALRITPMRPIERNGLKGFGLTVFIDNSNQRSSSSPNADQAGEVAISSPASPATPSIKSEA